MTATSPRFWAKTGKGQVDSQGRPIYHPVICHLADTAAVARELLRSRLSPVVLQRLSEGLSLDSEATIRSCAFLAGCHDLGKVAPVFQTQVSSVAEALAGSLYDLTYSLPFV
ncbi:HD domain-containing protein, partial (plasmid) [Synechococcus elongatus PCC 11802]